MLVSSCAPRAVTVVANDAWGGRPGFTGQVTILDSGAPVPRASQLLGHVCVRARDLLQLPAMWETAAATAAGLGANAILHVGQIDRTAADLFIPGIGRSRAMSGASGGLPIIPATLGDCYGPNALLIVRAYWVPGLEAGP
jgi:hypothetical protein